MKKILFFLFACVFLTGCSIEKQSEQKISDLDFTVVTEEDIPEELKNVIQAKKEQELKMTYSDEGFLYILVGYGEQENSGYSIAVEEVYLTENSICVRTNLIGPEKEENVSKVFSYPYIVLKVEDQNKSVKFQ